MKKKLLFVLAMLLIISVAVADYNPPLFSTPNSTKGLTKLSKSFTNDFELNEISSKKIFFPTYILYNGKRDVRGDSYYRIDFVFDGYQYKYLVPYLKLDVYTMIKKVSGYYYGKKIYSSNLKVERVNSNKYVAIIRLNFEKLLINHKSYKSTLPVVFKFYLTRSVASRFTTIISYYKLEVPKRTTTVKVNFTSSPSGAVVYLGSKLLGITPFSMYLKQGSYLVRFFKKGYPQQNIKFTVFNNTTNVSAQFEKKPVLKLTGIAILNVNPPDATIMFNGKLSPQNKFVLPAGSYTVAISAKGYKHRTFTFTVEPNKTKTYYVSLERLSARLILNVNPSDSSIYVDNKLVNGNVFDLPFGIHDISIKHDGYASSSFAVNLIAGKTTTMNISLQPLQGYLYVTSNVKAKVYVDGKYIGDTNINNYALSLGEHSVEIISQSFNFKTQVEIQAGKATHINLSVNIN